MARERKSAEERQAEIVQAALDLIGEAGAKDVTAQAIADRVGIAQPTVFRHFPTRDAIFRAAITFVSGQVFRILDSVHASGGGADVRLQTLLSRQLALISRNPGLPRLLFSDRLHLEDSSLKKAVQSVLERYIAHVQKVIEDGQREGIFGTDIPAHDSARLVAATVQGLLIRWSLYDYDFPLQEQGGSLWRYISAALGMKHS